MSETSIFTSLDLKKVKPLPVDTDFDVYENYYFASDIETLKTAIPNEVNSTLRQGYGLLNDDYLFSKSVLNREKSIPGVCLRLHFYRPLHFETFCTIGQEHSKFHEDYFMLCAKYLAKQYTLMEFIQALKQLEEIKPIRKALYTQEFCLFTSQQSYDESVPEHIYKERIGIHPYLEMYKKAQEEASNLLNEGYHFINYYLYNPVVNGTLIQTSENNFTVCLGLYKLKKLSIDEALSIYTFDVPQYVFKTDVFYKEFTKISTLYLMSELSLDEFYAKLYTLEAPH